MRPFHISEHGRTKSLETKESQPSVLQRTKSIDHESITPSSALSKFFSLIRYELHSLFLFTYSDMKTTLFPSTIFGIATAFASPIFSDEITQHPPVAATGIMQRAPLAVTWVWLNLLAFTIGNQRHTHSIEEDKMNKPWRVMPAQRMTQARATKYLWAAYGLALVFGWNIGGFAQCAALLILGYWHNDLGGANTSYITKNLLNGLGYISFASGAMSVSLGGQGPAIAVMTSNKLMQWFGIIAALIFTTIHAQDIYDQPGDAHCGRRTVPLVIGDIAARWSLVVGISFWSVVCPWFWGLPLVGYLPHVSLAWIISARFLRLRTVKADRKSFMLYNIWVMSVYITPVLQYTTSG